MPLGEHETCLTGGTVRVGRLLEPDPTTKRIERLVEEELERVACDSSGWTTLYRDPRTGLLWIRDYPQSAYHGGGMPRLRRVTEAEARAEVGDF